MKNQARWLVLCPLFLLLVTARSFPQDNVYPISGDKKCMDALMENKSKKLSPEELEKARAARDRLFVMQDRLLLQLISLTGRNDAPEEIKKKKAEILNLQERFLRNPDLFVVMSADEARIQCELITALQSECSKETLVGFRNEIRGRRAQTGFLEKHEAMPERARRPQRGIFSPLLKRLEWRFLDRGARGDAERIRRDLYRRNFPAARLVSGLTRVLVEGWGLLTFAVGGCFLISSIAAVMAKETSTKHAIVWTQAALLVLIVGCARLYEAADPGGRGVVTSAFVKIPGTIPFHFDIPYSVLLGVVPLYLDSMRRAFRERRASEFPYVTVISLVLSGILGAIAVPLGLSGHFGFFFSFWGLTGYTQRFWASILCLLMVCTPGCLWIRHSKRSARPSQRWSHFLLLSISLIPAAEIVYRYLIEHAGKDPGHTPMTYYGYLTPLVLAAAGPPYVAILALRARFSDGTGRR